MIQKTTVALADLPAMIGEEFGPSEWMSVPQDRIDLFADATDDHQWIHVDPERAAAGPFGAPIAHGFLVLSLLIPLWTSLFDVDGVTTKVNYGLNRVRFVSPVAAGSRVRLSFVLADVEEVKGGAQLTLAMTIELEGSERPAVAAEFLARFYV
ncbi:MaoC family dehydratase [Microcella alkalica]|uniref:Acyl dehydratase n=2 Tax=Microcella alkalica TaxID=355930 RepID=A0A839EC52_9MICO|nr:MaoC family dehydratase [Microcella alkalica]MBA8848703.1 acyl dehydratase [Microcella alkalica]